MDSYEYTGHKMTGSMQFVSYQKLVDGVVKDFSKNIGDTFEYERNGNVNKIQYADGSIVTYEYGLNGAVTKNLPTSIVKVLGSDVLLNLKLTYDDKGNVLQLTDAIEEIVATFTYDNQGNVTKADDRLQQEESSKTTSVYNAEGNPVEETTKAGTIDVTTKYTYDSMGRVLTEECIKENTFITHEYDSFGREIKTSRRTGSRTEVTEKEYDANGCVVREVLPEGVVNTYVYDAMNRVIQKNETADGITTKTYTTYEYTNVSIQTGKTGTDANRHYENVLHTTLKDEQGVILSETYADEYGQVVRSMNAGVCIDSLFDGRGNARTTFTHGEYEVEGMLNAYIYDPDGNQTAELVNAEWDAHGNICVGQNTIVTSTIYDELGNIVSETDGEGNVTGYSYTEDKKLSAIALPGAKSLSRRFLYAQKTEDGSFADQTFDAKNHRSETVTNAAGQTLSIADYGDGDETVRTRYEYDSVGNQTRQINGNGSYVVYTYDEKQQCIRDEGFNASGTKVSDTFYEYDDRGHVIRMKDYKREEGVMTPSCITFYQYNQKGLLVSEGQIMQNLNPTEEQIQSALTTYRYDEKNNLIEVTYPDNQDGITGEYLEYNTKQQLVAVKAVKKGETAKRTLRTYAYNGRGSVREIRENLSFANGKTDSWLIKTYQYDAVDRVRQIQYAKSSDNQVFEQYTYEYDRNSNITKETLKRENEEVREHTYTAQGQLAGTQVTIDGVSRQPYRYTYDIVGNRTSVQHGSVTAFEYNGLNQMIRKTDHGNGSMVTDYTYDGSGNQVTSVVGNNEKTCYEYDPQNRLISEKRQTGTGAARLVQKNAYNGDGLRVSREEPDAQNPAGSSAVTNYFYRQGNLSYTTDAKGAVTSKYLYGNGDGVIAREETLDDAKVYSFYTKDIKGSTMSLLNENGQHAVSYVYDDFGKTDIKPAAGNIEKQGEANEICYTGGVYDRTTEQYYLNARYYSPDAGNFLTQDSYRGTQEDENTWNLYAYCAGNPVNYTDPSGHFLETIADIISTGWSGYDLVTEPSWENAGWLALDIGATLLPFLPGSYAAKGGKAVVELAAGSSKVSKVTGTVKKAAKTVGKKIGSKSKKVSKIAKNLGKTNLKMKPKASGKGAIGGKVPKAACFVAGTLVTAKDGLKPIEKVKAGDFVYSENPETGEKGLKKVVQTFVNETEELIHIHADEQDIVTTPEHPFYVPVKGWTNAADLRAGDILVTVNGEYKVVEKIQHELLESPIQVYNFEVEDFHTYYVGDSSILVHNACKVGNLTTLKDNYIKKTLKLDAHSIKREYLGQKAKVSRYDLSVDKATKQIYITDKSGKIAATTHYKTK